MPKDIDINISVLTSVNSMKEDEAGKIIQQTDKAMINWKLVEVQHKNDKKHPGPYVTVTVPAGLGDGPWFIVLVNKEGETIASLGYDPIAEKFPAKEEDEDQSDPYKEIVKAIGTLATP
jgi:hypothetical protein